MNIAITGATGFIGKALLEELSKDASLKITIVVRMPTEGKFDSIVVGDLVQARDLASVLKGFDVVIHLAARVHMMREGNSDPLSEYRRVNVSASLNLAKQAARAGVRRFIFLSSIKVNGDYTKPSETFSSEISSGRLQLLLLQLGKDKISNHLDYYALSKFEAEQGLRKIAEKTEMELVVIRPPLVYGAGVKGNFFKMMKWVNGTFPLPFGGIKNLRSLVYVENLTSLIAICIQHPKAANQTFLVSDGQDLSTSELLQYLATFLGSRSTLLKFPQSLLKWSLLILGRKDVYSRLCGNLQLDIEETCQLLTWKPPVCMEKGLSITAKAWLEKHN